MECFGYVSQIACVETSHGDTAIGSHVDSILFTELHDHLFAETGVGEHTNLVDNVVPVVLTAQVLHVLVKTDSHLVHTAGHHLEIFVPHRGKLLITEDNINDTGTVNGRVGVEGTGECLNTGHNDLLFGWVSSDKGNAAGTFTVDTEVLGEGLEQHNVVGVFGEESKGVGILLEVTRGETLISRVESGIVVLSLDDIEDILPLSGGRVNTGGVVGANV